MLTTVIYLCAFYTHFIIGYGMNERKFKGTAIQMLMAAGLIIDNAIAVAEMLNEVVPKWTESYLVDIKGQIRGILEDSFGIKDNVALREATAAIATKEIAAKSILQQVKNHIEVDFEKNDVRRKLYLITLGLSKVKTISNASQDATIEMLNAFRNNLTPAIEDDLTTAGISPNTIASVKLLANDLYQANVVKEHKKQMAHESADTLNAQLNNLYDEVIVIARVASSMLVDRCDAEKFSYPHALKLIGYHEPPVSE